MKAIGVAGVMVVGAAAAACDGPPVVTVHAHGATLVAIDVGPGWEARPAGDVTFTEPDGIYRIAVTCRADIGDTTFVVAAVGDPTELDLDCPSAGTIDVTFAVTGDVYGMFIGDEATYSPDEVVRVAPGTYDVVATQHRNPEGTFRAQVIRDVVIDGSTRIEIDVERFGVPLEDFALEVTGGFHASSQLIGVSARGTWFQLGASTPRRLPAAVRVLGDRQYLYVRGLLDERFTRPGRGFEVAAVVADADLDVVIPTLDSTVTFTTAPVPAVALSSVAGWESAGFHVFQDNTYGVPGWYVSASVGALARGARLAFPEPLPPGWRPSWTVDTAGYYRWGASVRRARADGGFERLYVADGVYDPEN